MNDDIKSFIAAVFFSALVLFGFNYFFPQNPEITEQSPEVNSNIEVPVEVASEDETKEENLSMEDILKSSPRIKITNNSLSGSLRLTGLRFDELFLSKYKQTLDENSLNVQLFSPAQADNTFYAEYGWLSQNSGIIVPDKNSEWEVLGNNELTPNSPITLVWENGQGIKFIYDISVDDNYLFDIKQTIENNSGQAITLYPYGRIKRVLSEESKSGVVHEGFTAFINNDLEEIPFNKIDKDEVEKFETTGGWVSFSEKYWFSSFIFNDTYKAKINLRKIEDNTYQLDFKGLPLQIQSGSASSFSSQMYAGAKDIKLLDKYSKNIKKFDLNIDFGWYYFLTKPFFYILDYLYNLIGNMGWAILLFAACLRLFMFPIANKSFESMSKMKKIQPKIMALQAIYKDDKVAMQRATMELYQKEKINPASGCLPMFIQIPIFFSLFKVLNIALEIRHAPFIGWIKDLSAPDPLTISAWSGLPMPSMLDIGIWPIVYGFTMYIQQRLNPAPANKDQARMFAMLPIIFTIMFAHFASGLVIYWTLSNILSIIQQRLIMRKNGVK